MTVTELVQFGTDLVANAQAQNLTLRLCEGVAIAARCPSIETQPALQRTYLDLDFIAPHPQSVLNSFFTRQGFQATSESAASLILARDGVTVEVLPTRVRRDFTFDFAARLSITPLTLPLADLLLLKLGRLQFEEKDIQDAAALLVDHRVDDGGDEAEDINREYLYRVANQDYRLWKAIFDNTVTLEKVFPKYLEAEQAQLAWRRVERLQEVLDGKSHSLGWWAGRVLTRSRNDA
jgi:hypothetical protein